MQQVTNKETEILLELLGEALGADGDVVELGCYKGETSVLLQKMLQKEAPEKKLWLYDSFMGLPEKTAEDSSAAGDQFKKGELDVSKKEVVLRFKKAGLKVPIIKKGFFEDLDAAQDLPAEICFAFLDGDLYRSIKTSLELVAPKMAKGGIIVVHDYNNPELPGATRAVDEFISSSRPLPTSLRPLLSFSQRETLAILHC